MNNWSTNIEAFLWAIRRCEGTSGKDGYRMLFGGDLFEGFEDHPNIEIEKSGYKSSAAGAYQILYKTWKSVIQPNLALPDFSPASQDRAAIFLIENRNALQDVGDGNIEQAVEKCNKEWASLPGSPYGQPVYEMEYFMHFYDEAKGRADIERVKDIEDVSVSGGVDIDTDLSTKTVIGGNKGIPYYAIAKESRLERISGYVLDTLAGKNKAGKGLGQLKNLATWIFPVSKPIDTLTDKIGDFIKSKRTDNTMNEKTFDKIKRFLKQPSTRAGLSFVVMVLSGVWAGVDIDVDTLLQTAIGVVAAAASLWTAVENLINIFRDEEKTVEKAKAKRNYN